MPFSLIPVDDLYQPLGGLRWVVFDTKTGKSVRADNLAEVREHVADVMRRELRAEFPAP